MQIIYKLIIIPILTFIIGILGPLVPHCDGCDSKATLSCEECGGDGFNYSIEYDTEVVCANCGGSGKVNCTECSDLAKIFYTFAAESEDKK